MTNCQPGQSAEITVNGKVIGNYSGQITFDVTSQDYWDYVFVGTVSSRGCKTWYSVIYREIVDTTPLLEVDFRSGQFGSCGLPIKDVRAKVSFDRGNTFKTTLIVNNSTGIIPDPNNPDDIYPNGSVINWHGNSVFGALPTLFSKTQTTVYNLKIYSNGNLVFEKDYTEQPTVNIVCFGTAIPHDCINGKCEPKTKYNTPGFYKSLADCEAVCGNGGVCASGKQCLDPVNYCPPGKVCIEKGEHKQIKNLIQRIKNSFC